MAITDTGVPTNSPHHVIKQLIQNNLVAPPASGWTPVVNNDWFQYKKAKTYQIAIAPLYSETEAIVLTGGLSSARPSISTGYYHIALMHPDRESAHALFKNLMALLNKENLTSPQNNGQYTGVGGSDYHFLRVVKSNEGQMIVLEAPDCGPGGSGDDKCVGYQYSVTVMIRWNE
jgi:hypothetical protein